MSRCCPPRHLPYNLSRPGDTREHPQLPNRSCSLRSSSLPLPSTRTVRPLGDILGCLTPAPGIPSLS